MTKARGCRAVQTLPRQIKRLSNTRQRLECGAFRRFSIHSPGFAIFSMAVALTILFAEVASAQFSASVDRDTVIVGEVVNLSLKFENVQPSGMPNPPQVPGLALVGAPRTSTESRIDNGALTSSTTYSYPYQAQKAGTFLIPPMTVDVEGKKYQSPPITLKVLQSDPSAPPADYGNKIAFLWPVLPKKEYYIGEAMVIELRLYLRSEVRRYGDFRLPPIRGDGFTGGKQANGQRFQRQVGNNQFTVISIYQAMTPVKTGDLALAPLNGSVVVKIPTGGPRNPFDIDMDDPFGPATRSQQVPLTVDQQTIRVLPLPTENVPPGFSGAIGTYTLSFSAGPTNVAAGDPITVKIQISGRGYLDGIALPDFGWKDFKTYPPTSKVETTDPLGLEGTKSFEQLVTPQSAEVTQIPGFAFTFFNPDAKRYQTLSQAPIPITVRPGGTSVAPTIAAARESNENPAPARDIVPIKQHFGALVANVPPLPLRAWFLALQSVPALAFVGALVWRKRQENWANNPRLRRKRMVEQIMTNGIQQLHRHAAANNSDEFFATLFRLLQEQIGERLDLPASAITESVVEEQLRPRGVSDETLQATQQLFQTCNMARYAPMKTSQELAAVIPQFEGVVARLREVR